MHGALSPPLSHPPALPSPLSHFQKGLRLPASQLLGRKSNQGRAGGTRQNSSPGLRVAPDGCRLLPAQVLIRLGRSQGLREGGAVRRALGCGPSPDSLSIVLPGQRRPSWTPERGRFLWLELLPVEEEEPRVLEPAGSYEPGATHMWRDLGLGLPVRPRPGAARTTGDQPPKPPVSSCARWKM